MARSRMVFAWMGEDFSQPSSSPGHQIWIGGREWLGERYKIFAGPRVHRVFASRRGTLKNFPRMDMKRARRASCLEKFQILRDPLSPDNDAIFINGLAFVNTGRSISRFGDDTVCILSFLPLTLPKSSVFYREIVYELELHGWSSFDILIFFFFCFSKNWYLGRREENCEIIAIDT